MSSPSGVSKSIRDGLPMFRRRSLSELGVIFLSILIFGNGASEPFRLRSTARVHHEAVAAWRFGHRDLLGDAGIDSHRRHGRELIGCDIGMFRTRSSYRFREHLIEDPERYQPKRDPRERNDNFVAAAFNGTPLEGLQNSDSGKPTRHVIVDDEDWRRGRLIIGSFQTIEAHCHAGRDVESDPVGPGTDVIGVKYRGVNQAGIGFAKRLSAKIVTI